MEMEWNMIKTPTRAAHNRVLIERDESERARAGKNGRRRPPKQSGARTVSRGDNLVACIWCAVEEPGLNN